MIRFLLISFLVIYLLIFIGRKLFSIWVNKMSNQNSYESQHKQRKEGEVTVDMSTKAKKKFDKTDGEYVDYEEVD